jgi:hypothetical protein
MRTDIAVLLAVLATSAACDGGAGRAEHAGRGSPPPDTARRAALVTTAPESLAVTLHVPRQARLGENVTIVLRVRNTSSRAVDLYLTGREPVLDVVVTRAAGDTVWHRLAAETIPAIAMIRPLAAGETMETAARWDQRTGTGAAVDEGEYEIRAQLVGETRLEATAPLRIRGR